MCPGELRELKAVVAGLEGGDEEDEAWGVVSEEFSGGGTVDGPGLRETYQ